jgi:hypothetical protein
MHKLSDTIVKEFGGISKLADLVKAPASTANSWRTKITDSRLDHLKLAALREGLTISWDTLETADADEPKAAA